MKLLPKKTRATTGRDVSTEVRTRRRRPGDQQREQKENTRQKLLEAALAVFGEWSYSKASVEMIADEAGVSRTTFYRHFDGKLPLAIALFGTQEIVILELWDELFALDQPTLEDCCSWLERFLGIVEPDRVLLAVLREMDATEPDAAIEELHYYGAVLQRIWGEHIRENDKRSDRLKAKSLLMLLQLDQFIYTVCVRDWEVNRGAIIQAMAEQIHDFLQFRRAELDLKRRS